MPQILNFDTVACDYIDIVKNGKTYHLRDDVPVEVIAPIVATIARMEAWQAFQTDASRVDAAQITEAVAAIEEISAELAHRCGEIFRHTLPEITDEHITKTFPFDERLGIVQIFFSQAGKRFSPPPSPNQPMATQLPRTHHRRRH